MTTMTREEIERIWPEALPPDDEAVLPEQDKEAHA
jgi:hypothetical protein